MSRNSPPGQNFVSMVGSLWSDFSKAPLVAIVPFLAKTPKNKMKTSYLRSLVVALAVCSLPFASKAADPPKMGTE
jgi:hypothetical protein